MIEALNESAYRFWDMLTDEEFNRLSHKARMICYRFMESESYEFYKSAPESSKAAKEMEEEISFIDKVKDPLPAPKEIEGKQWSSEKAVRGYLKKLMEIWNKNNEIWSRLYEFKHHVYPKYKHFNKDYVLPDHTRKILVRRMSDYYKFCKAQREKLNEIKFSAKVKLQKR